jgi:hypothetical protein
MVAAAKESVWSASFRPVSPRAPSCAFASELESRSSHQNTVGGVKADDCDVAAGVVEDEAELGGGG